MTDRMQPSELSKRAADIERDLTGDLHLDELHRRLYAQDASIYEKQPAGVAYPKSADDIQQLVGFAEDLGLSLIPRGGGTSLAGQCVGDGLVVDVGRHMNDILEVDEEEGWVRVQPGIVLDDLNRYLVDYGLMFGPDTSTSDQCQIGGMIGNNSCGSHSVYYGTTRDHVLELEIVLTDGERVRVGQWDEIESNRELIGERYPRQDMMRRNSGYALDEMLARRPFQGEGDPFSLTRMLCGSEGTLAFVTEAKLNLVKRPGTNLLACAHFETLQEALRATVKAVEYDPAAVELMDKRILDLTREHPEHRKNRFFVEGDPGAILVIEFYGDSEEDVENQAKEAIEGLEAEDFGYAYPLVRPPKDKRVWKLRKAGLGMLMGIKGDRKPVTVVEDTAVALDELPDYISDFSEIMDDYSTQCVYYAHASVGELHLRPELNLKQPGDAEKFEGIARDVADLVRDYRGSLSGEHGDGRVRSPLLERFYGEEIVDIFRRIKGAFDPKGIMNPDKIVDPEPIDEPWRVEPGRETPEVDTVFDWSSDEGLVRAVEKCNGAGVCRKRAQAGGTMCPSYMATLDEKDTTRGRANVFRQLLYGDAAEDAFASETLHDALDLCLSCKGCKTECPANVDMARMKAEFTQHYHDEHGAPQSAKFFGNYRKYARFAAIFPWLANFMASFFLTRWFIDKIVGISPQRQLPSFAGTRFSTWFERRDGLGAEEAGESVWLYVDPFTEFNEPEVGKAAVRVLEAGGYRVELFPIDDDGRTHLSKGLVRKAREITNENLRAVDSLLEQHPTRSVIGLEPSSLLTFRDETPDLADPDVRGTAEELAERALLFEEFVEGAIEEGHYDGEWGASGLGVAHVHGHCHQKALVGTESTERVLEDAGYTVETIPSGCCGMAGSFGYEDDHYDVSMEIGELVLFPAVRDAAESDAIAAPGTSCRHQIVDGTGREADHPAVLLERALSD